MTEPAATTVDRSGPLYALAAYGIWGVVPLYFVWVGFAGPFEILSHRILWSVVFLGVMLTALRRWGTLRALTPRAFGALLLSGVLIAGNWGVFVWAIANERLVQASLGYYLNPLVNVLLGVVLLSERLRPLQWLAVAIAAAAVAIEVGLHGGLPWVSLVLAFSFAFYGLVRKSVPVDPFIGLFIEVLLVSPLAFAYLWQLSAAGQSNTVAGDWWPFAQLALGGFVTIVPLLCFAAAAARMPLAILGFYQYLAPTLSLLLATTVLGEPFDERQLTTFALIWLALIVFSAEAWLQHRRRGAMLVGST
ncbi:MAG: EamA family transporter RarD [Pseudomonadota bacterium]